MKQFKALTVKPVKEKHFTCNQSKYEITPKLPLRAMVVGPSQTGKSTLIQSMILDIYRGCFERIYIFSPSIELDHTWQPVKDYIKKDFKVDTNKEKVYFEENDPPALEEIIENQKRLIDFMKKGDCKKMFNILIVFDDLLDDVRMMKHNSLLNSLFIRGRHMWISTIVSSQVYRGVSSIVRKNITDMFLFKIPNQLEFDAIAEEVSALADKKPSKISTKMLLANRTLFYGLD